jgi:hypothetical protein
LFGEAHLDLRNGRIKEFTMEWTTIAASVVACAAIVMPVWAVQWGSVRRAQAEARVKQDMLARGLSVEEIERLLKPPTLRSPPVSRPSDAALALASAVESMVTAEKGTDEIAAFIDAFLGRHGRPLETNQGTNDAFQPTEPATSRL